MKKYRESNPELFKKLRHDCWIDIKNDKKKHEKRLLSGRKYVKNQVDEITDKYLLHFFDKKIRNKIPDWLIELKRSNLKLKRRMEEYNGKTKNP